MIEMTSKEKTFKRNGFISLMIIIALFFVMDAMSQTITEDEDGNIYEEYEERVVDNVFFLPVSGVVKDGKTRVEGAQIKLYCGNTVVNTFQTRKNGKFEMELDLGADYTIEVLKEGYIPKRIGINTASEVDYKRMEYLPYGVDISLTAISNMAGVNTDVLDYPFALVSYDHNDRLFLHNEEYTEGMKVEEQRLHHSAMLLQAKEKKREF